MLYPDDLRSGKIHKVTWVRSDITSAYIRELPESTILGKIPHQALVIYLDFVFYDARLWFKVIYGEVIGWVSGHLTPVTNEEDL